VSELVAEIAAASSEQSQGITQVNTAVTDIDKVTQQNAANAEESASAAEEMSAQAEQMKAMVQELVVLVEGGRRKEPTGDDQPAGEAAPQPGRNAARRRVGPGPALHANSKHPAQTPPDPSPDQVIPLDDADFKDF
jgi:methyl-accepting chemotaxis protein